jgi:hypothetical protein
VGENIMTHPFLTQIEWPPKEMRVSPNSKLIWKEVPYTTLNFPRGVHYEPLIRKAQQELYNAEVLSAVNGDRLAFVSSCTKQEYKNLQSKYPNMKFFVLSYVQPYSGFAHEHHPADASDPRAMVHFIMANQQLDFQELRRAMNMGGIKYHKDFGKILGYPECCTAWFTKWWYKKEACCNTHYDIIWHMDGLEFIEETQKSFGKLVRYKADIYPEANQFLRYNGLRLVPYMVCSPKCEETRKFGNMIAKYLSPEVYDFLKMILSQPMRANRYHGFALIESPKVWSFGNTDFTQTVQEIWFNGYNKEYKYGKFIDDVIEKLDIKVAKERKEQLKNETLINTAKNVS